MGERCRDASDHGILIRHIDALNEDITAMGAQSRLCRRIFRFIKAPDGDAGPRRRQTLCHAKPDTAIAAGNQRNLAAQIKGLKCHATLLLKTLPAAMKPACRRVAHLQSCCP